MSRKNATVKNLLEQLTAAIDDQFGYGRHAQVLTRLDRLVELICRTKLATVQHIDQDGVLLRGGEGNQAAGLLEWFYLLGGKKTIRVSTSTSYDGRTYVHVWVRGVLAGEETTARAVFRSDAARMAADCPAPSVHLLRRMQIAGVR